MEDIKIGRRKYSSVRSVPLANGVQQQIMPVSQDRTHAVIGCVTGQIITVPSGSLASGGNGIALVPSMLPFEIEIELHGDIVTQAWDGIGNGVAGTVFIIETFLARDRGQ